MAKDENFSKEYKEDRICLISHLYHLFTRLEKVKSIDWKAVKYH